MRYAKDANGLRIEAKQAGPSRAICGGCGESVFLKCGQKIVDHWCHLPGSTCVHAGTTGPETDWHRNWKGLVPEQYREVSMRRDGKLRRADIRAKTKTVIELQHSNIAQEEVASREEFYGKNMFWCLIQMGRQEDCRESREARRSIDGRECRCMSARYRIASQDYMTQIDQS